MIRHRREIAAPYPQNFLFDIAQDVENYPRFIPYCQAARVLERSSDQWLVENLYRFGPITFRFKTVAIVKAPSAIDIQSDKSEKLKMIVSWKFKPSSDNHCHVQFEMGLGTGFPLIEKLGSGLLDQIAEQTEHAFLAYAEKQYKQASLEGRLG